MAILTIGRVGLAVDLSHPSEAIFSSRFEQGKELVLRGFLTATSTTNERYLRTELLNQQGRLVAVTYTGDDQLDGFYILAESRIDVSPGTFKFGGSPFEVVLIRIGSDSRTELQSLLTGNTVTNSHSVSPVPWLAFPPGALAVNVGSDTPTEYSRTGEDGQMNVLLGINRDSDPTWSISPGSYYDGSVKLYTQGLLRSGVDLPKNDPTDWSLENGLVRIRPAVYQGTSNGELDFYFHNGSSWSTTEVSFQIDWNATSKIPKWHFMTCMWNEPEEVRIRLVRDAETSPPGAHHHQLDINLRRGAPYASFYYKYPGSSLTHRVARVTTDAATGATGFIKDTGTIDGNRWVLGTPQAHSQDTTNGKITASVASEFFKFWIGSAISDAADASGSGPADIRDQYHGWVSETVRAVRR